MDWLKDQKNRPVIAAIASVLVIGIAVVLWFFVFNGSGESDMSADMPASMPSRPPSGPPSGPPVNMGGPSVPAAPSSQPAAEPAASSPDENAQVASMPMESWRSDPFLPLNYKKPVEAKVVKTKPRIVDLPLGALFKYERKAKENTVVPEPPQPYRRMAGLLLNGKVCAIIETNGVSQIVQPGDTLNDRLAVVERIERDRVILKTTSENPRYLTVRMASAQANQSSVPGSSSGPASPTGPSMSPGRPSMMGPRATPM